MAAKEKVDKKSLQLTNVNPIELAARAAEIGLQLDNPPVNLDRGRFVTGTVSFGSLSLDLLTGGGLPPGKIVDVYGPESSGKSTLTYHVLGNCMRETHPGANNAIPTFLYDHEAGSDGKYLGAVGVKIRLADGSKNPMFNYFQPTTGESTYRHMNRILDILPDYNGGLEGRPRPTVVFAVDSLAAMLPEDLNNADDKNPMGSQAKLHGEGMQLIKSKLGRKNATMLCTNQIREKPGVMYGNPEYEPGGQAVRFYPDLKIRIQGVGKPFTERGRQMRFLTVRTIKNKQFVPFLELKEVLAVAHGHGFDRGYDSLGYLQMTNQVTQGGGGYYTLNMPNTHWDGQKFRKDPLMELCHKNVFRSYLRSQIEEGTAFDMYFASQNWEDMYKADEEDAGTGLAPEETGPAEQSLLMKETNLTETVLQE
jgi:recombination protein RecA